MLKSLIPGPFCPPLHCPWQHHPAPAMTTPAPPGHEAVENALRDAGSVTEASEAHGSLCGLMCVLGLKAGPVWLADTVTGHEETGDPALPVLDDLLRTTAAALEDGAMDFQPLLPGDEAPLSVRVGSFGLWCQGFNHGLAVAAGVGAAGDEIGSGDTAEIVRDFGEMAEVAIRDDENGPDDEAAYAELVEYVRVSVQLVFEELTAVRARLASAVLH